MDFQQLRALGGEALILRPRYPNMGLKGKEGGGDRSGLSAREDPNLSVRCAPLRGVGQSANVSAEQA